MLAPNPTPLLSHDQIQERVRSLAAEIARDLDPEMPVLVLGLLRGCFVFVADLIRALSREGVQVREVDFIIVSSYGSGTTSSGNINIERDMSTDPAGKQVLLVDDILDTGNTLKAIRDTYLAGREFGSLKTCVLLDKPSRRTVELNADYVGFSIEDYFVVGYGLDYDQKHRELPHIAVMSEEE